MQRAYIAPWISLWIMSASAIEVEKKFAGISATTPDTLEQHASTKRVKHHIDQYFDTPDNALYQDGAYTRLRTELNAEQSPTYTLCHKRIRHDIHGKQSRDEQESPVHDVTQTIDELHTQGLIEKARLHKQSNQYAWRVEDGALFYVTIDTITFSDNAPSKRYAEIEYAGSQLSASEALTYIDALAEQLGLHTHEPRSNLELAYSYMLP